MVERLTGTLSRVKHGSPREQFAYTLVSCLIQDRELSGITAWVFYSQVKWVPCKIQPEQGRLARKYNVEEIVAFLKHAGSADSARGNLRARQIVWPVNMVAAEPRQVNFMKVRCAPKVELERLRLLSPQFLCTSRVHPNCFFCVSRGSCVSYFQ